MAHLLKENIVTDDIKVASNNIIVDEIEMLDEDGYTVKKIDKEFKFEKLGDDNWTTDKKVAPENAPVAYQCILTLTIFSTKDVTTRHYIYENGYFACID